MAEGTTEPNAAGSESLNCSSLQVMRRNSERQGVTDEGGKHSGDLVGESISLRLSVVPKSEHRYRQNTTPARSQLCGIKETGAYRGGSVPWQSLSVGCQAWLKKVARSQGRATEETVNIPGASRHTVGCSHCLPESSSLSFLPQQLSALV